MIAAPANWTTTTGLTLSPVGLHGTVLVTEGRKTPRILCFEGVAVIEVATEDWTIGQIVQCVTQLSTPTFAQPWLRSLMDQDLLPLVEVGAIGRMEMLRLLSMVPAWEPS